mmetsp:Transcript_42748/g.54933  ORF Transcript_42748/g.54933 Transcript_42748/m.54933 type:complete len:209 (+) Transcript_42748:327-953(+)
MKTKGRRTTMDTNVFWGVLAAILPESIVHDRKQREAARMLGVDASVIRKGVDYRAALETGWKPIITSTHYDNVDWHPMVEWIHSEGSTIHNDHKDMVAVRQGDSRPSRLPCKEVLGLEHPRRKSLGTRSSERCAYLAQFHPRVTGNVNLKNGVWAPERLIYIHYPKELLKKSMPTMKESMPKMYHYRASMPNNQTADMVADHGQIVAR